MGAVGGTAPLLRSSVCWWEEVGARAAARGARSQEGRAQGHTCMLARLHACECLCIQGARCGSRVRSAPAREGGHGDVPQRGCMPAHATVPQFVSVCTCHGAPVCVCLPQFVSVCTCHGAPVCVCLHDIKCERVLACCIAAARVHANHACQARASPHEQACTRTHTHTRTHACADTYTNSHAHTG